MKISLRLTPTHHSRSPRILALLLCAFAGPLPLTAQLPATPTNLWPGPAPFAQGSTGLDTPTLTTYLPARTPRKPP